jgi:hypothetical protein
LGRMAVSRGPGAGRASAVVNMGPEPDMLAMRRATAQMVVDRGMVIIIFNH